MSTLSGGTGNDSLTGTTGQDSLTGNAGNDTLSGLTGNDTIFGGVGNDVIYGGATGAPTYQSVTNSQTVTGTTGQNYFQWAAEIGSNVTLTLDDGSGTATDGDGLADYVRVATTNSTGTLNLRGFDYGTDKIVLSQAYTSVTTTITQHSANTYNAQFTVTYANGNTQSFNLELNGAGPITAGQVFTTTQPVLSDDDNLSGGDDSDTFVEQNAFGRDTIVGGEAGTDNDTISLSAVTSGVAVTFSGGEAGSFVNGSDSISFTQVETLILTDSADTVSGGSDTLSMGVYGGAGNDSIVGGTANDRIYSGIGNDSAYGGGGDDSSYGGDGADLFFGGTGNDSFGDWNSDAGNDTAYGGDGNDILIGAADNDVLYGDAGNDQLSGGAGTDSSYGGLGDDWFGVTEDHGMDYLFGGEEVGDRDGLWLGNWVSTDGVTVTLSGNGAGTYDFNGVGDASGTFDGIEVINTTEYADTVNAAADTTGLEIASKGGADLVIGGSGSDTVYGGGGNDTVFGGAGNDSIGGDDGADALSGGTGNDSLYGGTDNDILAGGSSSDLLDGGSGMDTADYSVSGSGVTVNLATGLGAGGDAAGDTLSGIEAVIGSAYGDTLAGGAGADALYGGTGTNYLYGGIGNDSLFGGTDTDVFGVTSGEGVDSIVGGEGVYDYDYLQLNSATGGVTVTFTGNEAGSFAFGGGGSGTFAEIENITGTANADSMDASATTTKVNLNGAAGNDTLTGGSGNDLVYGGAENDLLYGGAGDDTVQGDAGSDALYGEDGNDWLLAVSGNDTGYGGGGNDYMAAGSESVRFDGGSGNDTLQGSAGNDTLIGGAGSDSMTGGSGTDTADYSGSGAGVTVNLAIGAGTGGDAAGDTLSGIEYVTGSAYNDSLTGYAGSNVLDGGVGNDTLVGGAGGDSLIGGSGTDTADYSGSGSGVTVNLAAGAGSGGDAANDTLSGIEAVIGSAYNDSLTGDTGANTLDGGAGNDTLKGGAGSDTLGGNGGNDTFVLEVRGGADVINDFDIGDDDNDGKYNDQIDVSDLIGGSGLGGSIKAGDVTVQEDGNGNALLLFPGGESLVLQGVAPGQINSFQQLQAAGIPCFTPGALVETDTGPVPVECLRPGHLVRTLDHDYQPVRWVGCRRLNARDLAANSNLRPVVIRKGALGNTQRMLVSPQHGFLIDTHLVRAKLLAEHWGGKVAHEDRKVETVTYVHFICDQHEIVFVDSLWTESLYPGPMALQSIGLAALSELLVLFPELARGIAERHAAVAAYGLPARPYMKASDLRQLGAVKLKGADWERW